MIEQPDPNARKTPTNYLVSDIDLTELMSKFQNKFESNQTEL